VKINQIIRILLIKVHLNWIMELSIKANGILKEVIVKVVVLRYGVMVQNLLAIGRMIKRMEKAA
jgi:hypothetical protein